MGNQDHLAMFFDFLSLHNQNPPVLQYPMKSLYKIKVSPTHKVLQMGQNQISYLTSPYKIKNHCMLGNRGFRGTILYRITVLSSQHLSRLQNQDLMDPKKAGFMKYYYRIKNLNFFRGLSTTKSKTLEYYEIFSTKSISFQNQKKLKTLHGESLQNQEPLGGHRKMEDFLVLAGQWCLMVFDFVAK